MICAFDFLRRNVGTDFLQGNKEKIQGYDDLRYNKIDGDFSDGRSYFLRIGEEK